MNVIEEMFDYPFLLRIFNKILTTRQKLNLICNKRILKNRTKFLFHDEIVTFQKENEWYFDCLTNPILKLGFKNIKLPKSPTHLTIQYYNYYKIKNINIPNTVVYLRIGSFCSYKNIFDSTFEEQIPKFIKRIEFSETLLNLKIPNWITHLKFGDSFNEKIAKNAIPNSVKYLEFGRNFNQSISGRIPNSAKAVTHLIFGESFSQNSENLKNSIPNSVTHLTFKGEYFGNYCKCIPNSVTHSTLGRRHSSIIKNFIPGSITHLTFTGIFYHEFIEDIPTSITHLTIYNPNFFDTSLWIQVKDYDFPSWLKVRFVY